MSTFFVSIQATYSSASISLFSDAVCIETVHINDARASSHLIPYLEGVLRKHVLTLADLAFIALDKGPGAFTSLRVCVATVNGIAFNKQIPLIGVDGLDALAHELQLQHAHSNALFISMLNAYNNDVYYATYAMQDGALVQVSKDCKKIDLVLEELGSTSHTAPLIFAGNGAYLHRELIFALLGDRVQFADPMLATASSVSVGALAYKMCQDATACVFKIEPLYMKTQYFAVKNHTVQ